MIEFILNNETVNTSLPAGTTVLDFVRYDQNLKGTKIGCREGDCGACTVLVGELAGDSVSYRSMTSCLGEVVDTDYTRGVVDIDQVLDDFTPKVRNDLRTVLRGSEQAIDGVVPQAQAAIAYGAPALGQADATLGELTAGGGTALRQLVGRRPGVLGAGEQHGRAQRRDRQHRHAAALPRPAERAALARVLTRAPQVLPDATRTLRKRPREPRHGTCADAQAAHPLAEAARRRC